MLSFKDVIKENCYTVSNVNKYCDKVLKSDRKLNNILIVGEITNFNGSNGKHLYFSLKEAVKDSYGKTTDYVINVSLFNYRYKNIDFTLENGKEVIVQGKIGIYPPYGIYQVYVDKIKLRGSGNLHEEFLKLKAKYEKLGYFKPEHKKTLPKFPKTIGVITSKTGAVIKDIMNNINSRYRLVNVLLYPTQVQGENAKYEISSQIEKANLDNCCDVLIVGRGGGSNEDLWAYNEEIVIKAIFNSKIPIVTAIGHERDKTLSDLVSDLSVSTPTKAAEVVTPDDKELKTYLDKKNIELSNSFLIVISRLKNNLNNIEKQLDKHIPINRIKNYYNILDNSNYILFEKLKQIINNKSQKLNELKLKVKDPRLIYNDKERKLKEINEKLNNLILNKYNIYKNKLELLSLSVEKLSPLKIMDRGYAYITLNNKVITSINQVKINDIVKIQMKDGTLSSVIKNKEKK